MRTLLLLSLCAALLPVATAQSMTNPSTTSRPVTDQTMRAPANLQPGNPAPMNGIWTLIQLNETTPTNPRLIQPAGQLVIASGQVHGTYGCGRYSGTLQAAHNRVTLNVDALPPRANERCLFAVRGNIHADLNAATQYVLSEHHLVLFSKTARLMFERAGYVTPVRR